MSNIDEAIEKRLWQSPDDLRAFKGPDLVYAYNGLRLLVTPNPKEVGKFADKETAVKRVWALYEAVGNSQNAPAPSTTDEATVPAQEAQPETQEEADMAKNTKKTAKKTKTPKTEGAKRGGRTARFTPEMKITKLVSENPFRAGAAKRFDLIRDGMTVAKYLEAGGLMADLRWDVKVKAIKIA